MLHRTKLSLTRGRVTTNTAKRYRPHKSKLSLWNGYYAEAFYEPKQIKGHI